MASVCPICVRESGGSGAVRVRKQNEEKFFRLFLRYLGAGGFKEYGLESHTQLKNPFCGVGMATCEQCLPLMDSFCELYHQLKTTELLINWKVETLKNVMSCARTVPSRMAYLRDLITMVEAPGTFNDVVKSRNWLIEKCSQKLTSAFPTLSIEKCSLDEEATLTKLITDPGATSVADGNGNQFETHRDDDDDPLSTHDGFQGFIKDPRINCQHLTFKIEPIDQIQTNLEPDVNFSSTSRDVNQMQLKDPPEPPSDLPPSDMNLTSNEPHTKRMSRLRATHRCQNCGRTFSSGEQLQLHIQRDHKDDQLDIEALSSDNGQIEDHDLQMDIESSCSPSSSEEQADNMEFDNPRSKSKSVSGGNKRSPSKKHRKPPRNPVKLCRGPHHLFKCPDCCTLLATTKDFLLHRKTSKSCGHSYDPTTSVRVEVLGLPNDAAQSGITATDSEFVDVLAVVDLPQEIYICGTCELAVYSSEDMEAHKKLHDSFKCHFCKVTKSYAPDLALHETQEHLLQRKSGPTWPIYKCIRCDFGSNIRDVYISHHLSNHLSLTFTNPECPICKTNSELMKNPHPGGSKHKRLEIGTHLKTHHDLRPFTNVEDLKKCKAENCHAYFLTAPQLKQHQRLRHAPKVNLLQRSIIQFSSGIQPYYRFKCPDCNGLFHSTEELLIHRKTSDSCSGSFDPSKSVKVDLLIRPDGSHKNPDGDETAFTTLHAIIDLPQAIFVCGIDNCGTVQYSSEDMEAHKKLHGTFPCNFCKSEHSSAPKLSIHELKHSKNERRDKSYSSTVYTCPRCDFKTDKRTKYVRHHLINHLSLALKESICPICKTHSSNLLWNPNKHATHFKNLHDLSATIPEDIERCTFSNCDAYFLFPNQLNNHLRLRHNLGSSGSGRRPQHQQETSDNISKQIEIGRKRMKQAVSLKCKDCGISYSKFKYLRAHRIKHHVDPDKAIPCTVPKCGMVFESAKQLKQHMYRSGSYHKSLDSPDVQCPKCDKSFSGRHPSFLDNHMKTHGVSHFCELCGKVFKLKSGLDRHHKSHSGPDSWEFMCSVCSKKFISKWNLDVHMRGHTKEKPFVCEICGSKYAYRRNLRIHANSKHGDEMEDKPRKSGDDLITTKKGVKRKRAINVESELDADERNSHSDSD